MNTYSNAFRAEMQGRDLENAYAQAFGGRICGGIGDGGLDIETFDKRVPFVQVKSSVAEVIKFLAIGKRIGKFIPICLGDPGKNPDEMIEDIKKYGAWIGREVPRRHYLQQAMVQARAQIVA